MPIDRIYRDAVPVEASATSLLSTGTTLPDNFPRPPPPTTTRFICQFGHGGICRAQMKHIDQFQPSYYQFDSIWICTAEDPTERKVTLCQIAVTW